MKQVIRNCVFETNSSSEHVLSHTCQVGRVPGWEFFFGKVSPLDKEIQFNYSEFEGIWTFSDKFLALCQSYYPFYRDCLQNKIDQIDKLDKWSTNDFSDYYEVDVSFCLNYYKYNLDKKDNKTGKELKTYQKMSIFLQIQNN